jgi:hypothetical protein
VRRPIRMCWAVHFVANPAFQIGTEVAEVAGECSPRQGLDRFSPIRVQFVSIMLYVLVAGVMWGTWLSLAGSPQMPRPAEFQ